MLIARGLEEFRVSYRSVHAFIDVSDLQSKQGIKRLQSDCTLPPSSGRCKANVIAYDDCCPDDSDGPVGAAATVVTDDLHRNINSESDTHDTDDDVDENDDDADAVDDDNDDEENVSLTDFALWTEYCCVKPGASIPMGRGDASPQYFGWRGRQWQCPPIIRPVYELK